MHRTLAAAIATASLLLGGCSLEATEGSGGDASDGSSGPGAGKMVTNKNWERVFDREGSGWQGADVRLVGQAYDRDGDLLLVWGDYENAELPAQVTGNTQDVSRNDHVLIEGTLKGSDSYETVMGANEETLAIDASSVREISEERAEKLSHPTTDRVKYDDAKLTKKGFTVEIKSIAWTDNSTRVAVRARNGSKDTVSLTAYDAVIKQGSKQYEQDSEQMSESSELDSDIRPGVTKEETLIFEPINKSRGKAELAFEWYSDDIDVLDPKPFEFELKWR
jgi:hypothetical protein